MRQSFSYDIINAHYFISTCNPILFADDNFLPLNLQQIEQLDLLLANYDQYIGVSGFNINVPKATVLCIYSVQELLQGLQQKGFTLATILHLGIELGQTGDIILRKTLQKINLKELKH
jgi:hypothetical protein